MIIEYGGKIFQIIFVKVHHHAVSKKKKILLIDTKCTILMKDKPSTLWSKAKILVTGESKQYIGDKYSKVIGKKYALLDALSWTDDDTKELQEAKYFLDYIWTKAFRTALWKKFNETFKGWKYKMTQKELVNGIFERLVKEAEVDHEPRSTFTWLEEERQMWLKKIPDC